MMRRGRVCLRARHDIKAIQATVDRDFRRIVFAKVDVCCTSTDGFASICPTIRCAIKRI